MTEIAVRQVGASGVTRGDGIDAALRAQEGAWVWIDVLAPDDATMRVLADRFDLHPLAVEDSVHIQMRPKIDGYRDSFFVAWLIPQGQEHDVIEVRELDIFMGPGYVITIHDVPLDAVVYEDGDTERIMERGPDWLVHSILDRAVDSVLPIVDALGDRLEDVEDAMLGEPRRGELNVLYAVRRQLVRMRRIVGPERDILRSLARERDMLSEEAYRYFQDIGDHLARVEDSIETYREVASAVMDIYLSAQSNRMNEIMKALTVVATIFMPLTLLSGIYGMNVLKGMWPPVDAPWSFWGIVGSMVVIAVTMSVYFRRKKWW